MEAKKNEWLENYWANNTPKKGNLGKLVESMKIQKFNYEQMRLRKKEMKTKLQKKL